MAIPMTPEARQALLDAALGHSQLANQSGAPYGGYRQAPSTLPGNPSYPPHFSPGGAVTQTLAVTGAHTFVAIHAEPIEDAGIRPGEVRAYRCWRWQQGFLQSVAMNDIWAPGEPMVGKATDHAGGGVHAWRTMSKALGYAMPYATHSDYGGGSIIVGQVELWGDIVEHEHGYRAEFASIVSLDGILGGGGNNQIRDAMLAALRKRYRVSGSEEADDFCWDDDDQDIGYQSLSVPSIVAQIHAARARPVVSLSPFVCWVAGGLVGAVVGMVIGLFV